MCCRRYYKVPLPCRLSSVRVTHTRTSVGSLEATAAQPFVLYVFSLFFFCFFFVYLVLLLYVRFGVVDVLGPVSSFKTCVCFFPLIYVVCLCVCVSSKAFCPRVAPLNGCAWANTPFGGGGRRKGNYLSGMGVVI